MILKCSNVLLKIKLRVTKLFLNATCIKTGTKMAQSSKVVDIKASVNRLSLSSICLRAARNIRIMFFIYLFFIFMIELNLNLIFAMDVQMHLKKWKNESMH